MYELVGSSEHPQGPGLAGGSSGGGIVGGGVKLVVELAAVLGGQLDH